MHTGYDRDEDEPYHWAVDLVIGALCFFIALGLALIPFWIEKQ